MEFVQKMLFSEKKLIMNSQENKKIHIVQWLEADRVIRFPCVIWDTIYSKDDPAFLVCMFYY